jgi:hypothetical protein
MNAAKPSDDKKRLTELMPKITNDEIDLEIDDRRDDEIKNDRPPHHN